jgi:translation initiation factor 1
MTDKPFHNPFGALAALRGTPLPEESGADAGPAAAEAPKRRGARDVRGTLTPGGAADPGRRGPARAVVRIERSGRSGKAVTVIEHLEVSADERDLWLRALKASLGCGGTLEGDAIVLQGDQRPRLPALLTGRGVRKVTVS